MKKPSFFVVQMPDARLLAVAIATNFRLGKCDASGIPPPSNTAQKKYTTVVRQCIQPFLNERSIYIKGHKMSP